MVMTAGVARQKEPAADDMPGKRVSNDNAFSSEEYDDLHLGATNSTTSSRSVKHNKSKARNPNNKSPAKSDNPFQRSTLEINDTN